MDDLNANGPIEIVAKVFRPPPRRARAQVIKPDALNGGAADDLAYRPASLRHDVLFALVDHRILYLLARPYLGGLTSEPISFDNLIDVVTETRHVCIDSSCENERRLQGSVFLCEFLRCQHREYEAQVVRPLLDANDHGVGGALVYASQRHRSNRKAIV